MSSKLYGQRSWRTVASAEQQERAIRTAMDVARRLHDLSADAVTSHWQSVSLAQGDAGVALVCGYVGECVGDASWSVIAHRFLRKAAVNAQEAGSALPGLIDGLAGLGFAASALSQRGTRYQRLLMSVDEALYDYLKVTREQGTSGGVIRDFDVVSGLAGLGVFFLQRVDDPAAFGALTAVAELLVGVDGSADTPLRWCTPGDAVEGPLRDHFPEGVINCGLAHGVPGPLAFLARSRIQGLRTAELDAAIEGAVAWLVSHCADDAWGPNWPIGVPLNSAGGLAGDRTDRAHPTRAAWCYGVPGVARALWLAGVAMDRSDWRDLAVDAMRGVYRRTDDVRQIRSPGLCHGRAGLLQVRTPVINVRQHFGCLTSSRLAHSAISYLLLWLRSTAGRPTSWVPTPPTSSGSPSDTRRIPCP
jgi:lantibiotic biosynthesis protein